MHKYTRNKLKKRKSQCLCLCLFPQSPREWCLGSFQKHPPKDSKESLSSPSHDIMFQYLLLSPPDNTRDLSIEHLCSPVKATSDPDTLRGKLSMVHTSSHSFDLSEKCSQGQEASILSHHPDIKHRLTVTFAHVYFQ